MHTCDICLKNYKDEELLKRHTRYAHSNTFEKCRYCPYEIPTNVKYRMKGHVERKHPEKMHDSKRKEVDHKKKNPKAKNPRSSELPTYTNSQSYSNILRDTR